MNRFLLFASTEYYPEGGWKDFISSHDTLDAAQAAGDEWKDREEPSFGNMHVVDAEAATIVWEKTW